MLSGKIFPHKDKQFDFKGKILRDLCLFDLHRCWLIRDKIYTFTGSILKKMHLKIIYYLLNTRDNGMKDRNFVSKTEFQQHISLQTFSFKFSVVQ